MSIIKRKAGSEDIVKSVLEFDAVPTEGSHNLVDSGAVAQAIGNSGKIAVFKFAGTDYPLVADMNAELLNGKDIVLMRTSYPSRYDVFYLTYRNSGSGHVRMKFTGTNEILKVENDVWTVTEQALNGVNNGGALTDAASVNVPNNALSTLSTAQATLTLNVNVGASEVPNFAVEVTPSVDVTLTVTKTVGSTTTTLSPSVAGGNSLTAGKLYQLTCVGNCWTLAEFFAS